MDKNEIYTRLNKWLPNQVPELPKTLLVFGPETISADRLNNDKHYKKVSKVKDKLGWQHFTERKILTWPLQ